MAVELREARTLWSKTFDEGGGVRRLHIRPVPMHYRDDQGVWQEIDLDNDAVGFAMTRALYTLEGRVSTIGMRYRSRHSQEWITCRLVQIDGQPLEAWPVVIAPHRRGRTVVWENCLPGLTIGLRLGARGVALVKRLTDASAPRAFTWRVEQPSSSPVIVMPTISGHDNVFRDPVEGRIVRSFPLELTLDRRLLSDDGATRVSEVTETWTGRILKRGAPSPDVVFPVEFDPSFQETITTNADDGEEYPVGTWNDTPIVMKCGHYYTSGPTHVGVRFAVGDGAGPNSGDVITSATLTLYVTAAVGSPDIDVYADDVDNAAAWSSTSRPSQITLTTAKTDWNPTFAGPDPYPVTVTSVVQEIINRPGWAQGNSLRFALLGQGSTNNYLRVVAIEHTTEPSAILDVTYTAGGGGGDLSVALVEPSISVTVF